MSHFDEMTVLLHLDGQLDAEQERDFSGHFPPAKHAAICCRCCKRKTSGCNRL